MENNQLKELVKKTGCLKEYHPVTPVIEGDIFEVFDELDSAILCHQANCQNKMKAGIAKEIAKRFPKAAEEDRKMAKISKLGNFSVATVKGGTTHLICNMYTQYDTKPVLERPDKRATDYDALCDAWLRLGRWLRKTGIAYPVLVPYGYGSGLAGGNWKIVKNIIDIVCMETGLDDIVVCKMPSNKAP